MRQMSIRSTYRVSYVRKLRTGDSVLYNYCSGNANAKQTAAIRSHVLSIINLAVCACLVHTENKTGPEENGARFGRSRSEQQPEKPLSARTGSSTDQALQSGSTESRERIAINLFESMPYAASGLVLAELARTLHLIAQARDETDRPFELGDDLFQRNVFRTDVQEIAAAFPSDAAQPASVFHLQKNAFQKSLRNFLFGGDPADRHNAFPVFPGQRREGEHSVSGFLGKHTEQIFVQK